jgi:transposase
MERYAITDEQWERIQHFFPVERPKKRGRHWRSHQEILSAIVWVICSGAKWRDVPKSYGSWKTVYNRFRRWYYEGLWQHLWQELIRELDLQGVLDWELWCVDGSSIRAHRCAAGAATRDPAEPDDHALGRSRGGFGTKLHLVVSGNGIPLMATATPGQVHESTEFEHVVSAIPLSQNSFLEGDVSDSTATETEERFPKALAGDKAFSSGPIRNWLKKDSSKM